jgi:hypothetical protein
VRVALDPVLRVCPDPETQAALEYASPEDSARIIVEHPCQPVAVVPSAITFDTTDSGPALACLPATVVRGQEIRCVMWWSSWEVIAWRFVGDRPVRGQTELPMIWERSSIREWAGVMAFDGLVTVFVKKGHEQRTFDTRVTMLDRFR